MDESFSVAGTTKFPSGEPNNEWTIEELLHWSLDQYHNKAMEQTSQNIASLQSQCEKECEDVMTLHSMAVDMANKGSSNDGGGGGNSREEENLNPQSENSDDAGTTDTIAAKSTTTVAAAGIKPASSTIEILVTVGPHTSSKYLLRPKPGTPCLVGRSKGKKFVKNGLSLHKDQEISTTHGKFVVEGGDGAVVAGGAGPKFYFIDVGSTNGSVYNGVQLEPNDRLLLVDGMELKVGNSVLKIMLG
mmetsp:Transcript_18540/g.40134  ORF Transcript_18540/g.40134 Transcript_18540/m.40134 type:complete len:245 (+) Transcript_18540:119-853(+)|eukprot:CAMPEP_0172322998 /NCGR_PEP_ID=MMETSP1058-20130122/47550_1 /TAXON_ID=83371 /ORGANISM="Detonula confervacea, Strain CCMP 353" /LENGTH=244 /DNA_ID=CAMNT_0013038893 /DNA_START=51 /DNA_END=785 /DNA_ORIENTATION=+